MNEAVPTPGDAGFGTICSEFNSSRCCNDNFTAAFGSGPGGAVSPASAPIGYHHGISLLPLQPNPITLYAGYTYNQCPQIANTSAACLSFLRLQECSYSCSPLLSGPYNAGTPI